MRRLCERDNDRYEPSSEDLLKSLALCLSPFVLLYIYASHSEHTIKNNEKSIPLVSVVQEGFAVPSKIEIICENFDTSDSQNLPETYLQYEGKKYLLKFNESTRTLDLSK